MHHLLLHCLKENHCVWLTISPQSSPVSWCPVSGDHGWSWVWPQTEAWSGQSPSLRQCTLARAHGLSLVEADHVTSTLASDWSPARLRQCCTLSGLGARLSCPERPLCLGLEARQLPPASLAVNRGRAGPSCSSDGGHGIVRISN